MELKRQNSKSRFIFVSLYLVALVIYITIGLQPVEAAKYTIDARLSIPAIGLVSDVTKLEPVNGDLPTPDTIVGSYSDSKNKTLLIGHSSTIFDKLDEIGLNDTVHYNDRQYSVITIDVLLKSDVNMNEILSSADKETIVIMTCAGQMLPNSDATHRLIITAVANG